MHRVRFAAEWLTMGLISLAIIALVVWFMLPRVMGLHPQVVLSGSMEPALQTGGVAFVEGKSASEVRVGDMLTYRHPERPPQPQVLVTHRVMEVTTDGSGSIAFKTRGDANDADDTWLVPGGNVLGTVRWHVPYMGHLVQRVRTPLGFLIVIAIPAAYISLGEIRSLSREIRKARGAKRATPA